MRHLWNTKLFILFLILTVSPVFSLPSPRVEIETPLAMTLGLTEIPLDDHDTYSLFLPYFAAGPLRARYIFPSDDEGRWAFGLGGAFVPWPFRMFTVNGSASYTLCTFPSGASLALTNTLDAGLFMYPVTIYDVNEWKNVDKTYFSPVAIYSLDLIYRPAPEKAKIYLGGGFNVGNAFLYGSDFFVYALHFVFGFYF